MLDNSALVSFSHIAYQKPGNVFVGLVHRLDRPTSGTATIDGRAYRELSNPLRTVGALLDAKAAKLDVAAADLFDL